MRFLIFVGSLFFTLTAVADVPGVSYQPEASKALRLAWWHRPPAQCAAPMATATAWAGRFDGLNYGSIDYERLGGAHATEAGEPRVILQRMNRSSMQLQAGASLRLGIPMAPLNLAFVVRNHTEVVASFQGHSAGQRLWGKSPFLDDTFSDGIFLDGAYRRGRMAGNGKAVTEAGLTLNHAFGWSPSRFHLDAAVTARRQDLYQYGSIAELASPYQLEEEQGINLNAGLTKALHGFDLAFNVSSLYPRHLDQGTDQYGLRTSASVATTLDCGFSVAELDVRWQSRNGIRSTPNQRYASISMAFSAAGAGVSAEPQPQLHLGYRHDLVDNPDSMATLGLGFSPSERLDLGLSGTRARSGAYGVMAELNLTLE